LHFFDFSSDEDASALASSFWLAYKHNRWIVFALFFVHEARVDQSSAFRILSGAVVLDVVEVRWIKPCLREKVIFIGEGFLKSL
jgi:hypothetical protein